MSARGTQQRGYLVLAGLLFVLVALSSVFLQARQRMVDPHTAGEFERTRALTVSRSGLRAYNLGDEELPGSLPCPDFTADGTADINCQSGSSNVYVERVPWRTLDLSRRAGEIWYALDRDFRDNSDPTALHPVVPLNTGTDGSLTIDGKAGYAAVLLAPGDPMQGQDRSAGGVAAYLEGDNADGDQAFVRCTDTPGCNDRLTGLSAENLLDPVRQRLLRELSETLAKFGSTHGHYPWAAPLGAPDGGCSDGTRRGTLAVEPGAGPCTDEEYLRQVAEGGELANWIEDNEWHRYIYYGVADPCDPNGSGCTSGAPGLLTLKGRGDRATIVATVGAPIVSAALGSMQDRSGAAPDDVEDYLDSAENVDADDDFNDPRNGKGENDRLRALGPP